MNIESSNINQTNAYNAKQASNSKNNTDSNSSVKFSDELKELESKSSSAQNNEEEINPNIENEDKKQESDISDVDISKPLDELSKIVSKLNQSEDKSNIPLKKNPILDDNNEKGEDLINNDFNIKDNKDILPQMSLNMGFSGDGQPFSSFMNNENEKSKNSLNASAADLKEEAEILSTMEENIAIANKNQAAVTIETVLKYDTIIMNEADVEVFTALVENGEVNLKNLPAESAKNSVHVSKTLADMLAKSMENNQPLRIDFDNGISVIIKVSRDGKISADFLPSTQIAEAYLKENLPILKQRFDEKNLEYDELNQRNRKDKSQEDNKKKGRRDE